MHHKRTALTVVALGALALLSAACGNNGGDAKASDSDRTVDVEMVDGAFKPTELTVAKGETVRFVFTNHGKTDHEAFLGTRAEQMDHDEEMMGGSKKSGHDMNMGGDDESAVTVSPGESGDFTKRFDDRGTFEIGCHEPGHYAAGMKLTVTVN